MANKANRPEYPEYAELSQLIGRAGALGGDTDARRAEVEQQQQQQDQEIEAAKRRYEKAQLEWAAHKAAGRVREPLLRAGVGRLGVTVLMSLSCLLRPRFPAKGQDAGVPVLPTLLLALVPPGSYIVLQLVDLSLSIGIGSV